MSEILRLVVIPALHEIGVRFLIEPGEDGGVETVVIPFETSDGGRCLINLDADDELREVMLVTNIRSVPERRLARTALVLAELNTRFKQVTFSLQERAVYADVCVELAHISDPGAVIDDALHRLMHALEESHAPIARAACGPPRRSRVLREADRILDSLQFECR